MREPGWEGAEHYCDSNSEGIDDVVHSPAHYRQGSMEVYDAITGMGLSYTEGAIVKYVARWRYKNGLEDLEKARWYLDRLIMEQRNAKD